MSLRYDCREHHQRRTGLYTAEKSLKDSELVVLPTDTVYGLACDAFSSDGVRRLLAVKERGPDMPVPVLVSAREAVDGLVFHVSDAVRTLVQNFWPGGLSLVVPQAPSLQWDLGQTQGSVMLRMPSHPVALELIDRVGPLAVSSANKSGQPAAVTESEAFHQLGGLVSVYLDGGPSQFARASTILDMTRSDYDSHGIKVLREGAVRLDDVARVLGIEVSDFQR